MSITYDSIGNPTSYRGMTFTYNDEGIRTSKTVNGVKTTYYLDGSRIVGEETSGNVTIYVYDGTGSPIGFQYHGADYAAGEWDAYWYIKNIQGDIVGIYDSYESRVMQYSYNAWGACLSYCTGGNVPENNAFKYRGYYYDKDLELYYVNSRYYDAETGRWLTPDSYVSTGQGLTASNMYAYCNNNPVMYADYTGEFPWIIVGILGVTTIVGGILGATSDIKLGENTTGSASKSLQDNEQELSVGDRIKNTVIGAGLGLAVGGAIIATGGVLKGAAVGIGASYMGVTSVKGFAIGALAINFSAMVTMPLFGIKMEPIEYETPSPKTFAEIR